VSAPDHSDPAEVVKLREPIAEDWYGSVGQRRPPLGTDGKSGTSWSGGRISGYEQQSTLAGSQWAKQSVQMRRTDGRLAASWAVRKQTALSASWKWEAGEHGDEESERYAAYANEAFGLDGGAGHLGCTWEEVLAQILEYVPVGFRYCERVYHYGRDCDGELRVWVTFEDREPSAHSDWDEGPNQTLRSVQQNPPNCPRTVIPADKLALFTHNMTGSNFEGVGADRAAWWVWKLKHHILDRVGVGVMRWSTPTVEVVVDRQAAHGDVEPEEGDSINTAIAALRDAYLQQMEWVQSVDESVVWHPPWIETKTLNGPGVMDWAGLLSVINWCDAELAANYTTEAMRLGVTETGARSVGEVHEQVLRRVVANDLDVVASVMGGPGRPGAGVIGDLIRWNFGAAADCKLPRLVHSGLEPDRLAEALPSLPALEAAGLLGARANRSVVNMVRDAIGAEPLTDEEFAALNSMPATGAPSAELVDATPDPAIAAARLADRIYEASRPRGQIEMPL